MARPFQDGVVDSRVTIVNVDVVHQHSVPYLLVFVKRASTRFCAISRFDFRCASERPGIGLFSPLSALPMFSVISLIFMLCTPTVFSRLSKQMIDIATATVLH